MVHGLIKITLTVLTDKLQHFSDSHDRNLFLAHTPSKVSAPGECPFLLSSVPIWTINYRVSLWLRDPLGQLPSSHVHLCRILEAEELDVRHGSLWCAHHLRSTSFIVTVPQPHLTSREAGKGSLMCPGRKGSCFAKLLAQVSHNT